MNVVLFSLVPLRADRLTCYGYYRDTTPAIDELAAEGVLFERTYATSPWTPPSHASTMTGQYPWNHGVRGDAPLVPSVRTMATHLRAAGMRTAAFVNTHHMGQYKGLDAGFEEFQQIGTGGWRSRRSWLSREAERRGLRRKNKGTAETTEQVVRWLRAQRDRERPFFLLVHYHEAHHPYWPPRRHRGRYSVDPSPSRQSAARRANLDPAAYFTQRVALEPSDLSLLSDLYDEEIAYLDREHIARVVQALKELALYGRTIVVVSSPHGESLGEHGLLSHVGGLYEPLVHVPLIIRHPTIGVGTRSAQLAQVTDILPTVIKLLDLSVDGLHPDGACLTPFAVDAASRQFVAAEWSGGGFSKQDVAESHAFYHDRPDVLARLTRSQLMFRVGSFKYIESSDGEVELFNLSADPGELRNLAPIERDRAARLAVHLRQLIGDRASAPTVAAETPPVKVASALRAQGYRL